MPTGIYVRTEKHRQSLRVPHVYAEGYKRIGGQRKKKGRIIACQECGKERYRKPYQLKLAKYRCKECSIKFNLNTGTPWNKGLKDIYKLSQATRKKMSLSRLGMKRPDFGKKFGKENHWNWKGGISDNPYPKEFNLQLKLKIRIRDNFTCCLCGRTEREELEELNRVLCVNHIDYDKKNCKEINLNALCLRCNVKVNRQREYWTDYFTNKDVKPKRQG